MRLHRKSKAIRGILALIFTFIVVAAVTLVIGNHFISDQLKQANEHEARDIAALVANNFDVSDAEVAHMKKLTFTEMEESPINRRLMDVGDEADMDIEITNVYVLAALEPSEIKYSVDTQELAEFFGYDMGDKLDGVWMFNGLIDENGEFNPVQRDDIYRYTKLTDLQKEALQTQQSYGETNADAWGYFISGYVPLYTTEGNFVGLLGIDINPDAYQTAAQRMLLIMSVLFAILVLTALGLFAYFYVRWVHAKEGQLYFDFYSRMSHDMRTPMNGILGLAYLSRSEDDPQVLRDNFKRVENAGKYMLGLVNDTLDVQKLDAGKLKLDLKPFPCSELVESITTMVEANARLEGITFDCEVINAREDTFVLVDMMRLEQIAINLSSNAIKFTPRGGSVLLKFECLGAENGIQHNRLTVSDTGIGMSEEFVQRRLFQPFEQEQASITTQYGGSGLGLSIVKSLVDLMGGTISVESEKGKGTTFVVDLDFPEVDPSTVENDDPVEEAMLSEIFAGKQILLCEDNELNAAIAMQLLESEGCIVTHVENGLVAVDAFENAEPNHFDIVLMDIRMPLLDGLEATMRIRALNRADASRVPIIAMTANTFDEDIEDCEAAGMNDHIGKPVDPKLMLSTIARHLI